MLEIFDKPENLSHAAKELDKYKIYSALDNVNIHIKRLVENLKPHLDTTRQLIEEYYGILQEAKGAIESLSHTYEKDQARILDEAKAKIFLALSKTEDIERACSKFAKEIEHLK